MTLYEMLAGRLPWEPNTSEFRVMTLKSKGDFPPPTDFYPEIPPAVVAVVERATAVKIEDRYPSVEALSVVLESDDDGAAPTLESSAPGASEVELGAYRLKADRLTADRLTVSVSDFSKPSPQKHPMARQTELAPSVQLDAPVAPVPVGIFLIIVGLIGLYGVFQPWTEFVSGSSVIMSVWHKGSFSSSYFWMVPVAFSLVVVIGLKQLTTGNYITRPVALGAAVLMGFVLWRCLGIIEIGTSNEPQEFVYFSAVCGLLLSLYAAYDAPASKQS
jgi:serine/threonine protein kinase